LDGSIRGDDRELSLFEFDEVDAVAGSQAESGS